MSASEEAPEHTVSLETDGVVLHGTLALPSTATGIVLFAHGSGSSRHSPRNRQVAKALEGAGIGTLLFDLLTSSEESADRYTGHLRFDVDLLAGRLAQATDWALVHGDAPIAAIGYFGASTGGAAALIAASRLQERVAAVVSRGGRPDLAGPSLGHVTAPTLLIVGELDDTVVGLNRLAYRQLRCTRELAIVAGATHLFEEPGAIENVVDLAVEWFERHLPGKRSDEDKRAPRGRPHPAA